MDRYDVLEIAEENDLFWNMDKEGRITLSTITGREVFSCTRFALWDISKKFLQEIIDQERKDYERFIAKTMAISVPNQ